MPSITPSLSIKTLATNEIYFEISPHIPLKGNKEINYTKWLWEDGDRREHSKAQLIRLTLMRAVSLHIAREAPFDLVPQLTASFDFSEHLNTVVDLPRKHLARKLSKEARVSCSWAWGISKHSLWPIKPHTQLGQILRWKEFLIKVMIRFITSNHNSLTRKKSPHYAALPAKGRIFSERKKPK